MTVSSRQLNLFSTSELRQQVKAFALETVNGRSRPSADELLKLLDEKLGMHARWDIKAVLDEWLQTQHGTSDQRAYVRNLIESGELDKALSGKTARREPIDSSIDDLLRASKLYRSSEAYREMIAFMARFRDYAPYNNMLVRIQDPTCSFYATEKDWRVQFKRYPKEDASPMLILAPMSPVLLVYALDHTEGAPLPEELRTFSRFEGNWESKRLDNLIENAKRNKIRVDVKTLSSTLGGFATVHGNIAGWKRRIAIHDGLDQASQFGVLCHELAHIFLGHLGGDQDGWWPARGGVDRKTAEIEAESVAYIVTTRFGLTGTSAAYMSGFLGDGAVPNSVSLDHVAKVAGQIERMSRGLLAPPKPKPPKKEKAKAETAA